MNDRLRAALAQLPPAKRAELEARLADRGPGVATSAIPPRADPNSHPIADGQLRLLDVADLPAGPAVHHLQRAFRLTGPLDADRLDRSLVAIVERHEALRARFTGIGPDAVQTIGPPPATVLRRHRLPARAGSRPIDRAIELAATLGAEGFELATGPFRADLISVANDDHLLTLTAHHIACDGWSMAVIERELSALYTADDPTTALAPLRIQATDVTAWERSRTDRHDDQLAHWRAALTGATPLLLPGLGRPDATMADAGRHRFEIGSRPADALERLARRHRATPHVVLLAAWSAFLHRMTGQDDLVVCSPSAGRAHPETHELVGYFNNILPLRCDLTGEPSLSDLVERLRPMVAAAVANEGPAFQTIARLPAVATTALTRCLLVMQDNAEPGLQLDGLTVVPVEVDDEVADFELELYARRSGDLIAVVLRHRHRALAPAEAAALGDGFGRFLATALAAPDTAVGLLELPADLPAMRHRPEHATTVTAPRSRLEAELRLIWERVLGRRPIAVDDDFFDLGGHSLLAVELMHAIEHEIVGEPIPLAALFAGPSIASMADLLASGGWARSWSSLVPIQPGGTRAPLFFVHAHGGNVLGYRDLARHLGPDQPFYGLQSPHTGGTSTPSRLEELAARYIDEIRTIALDGPFLLGGWCLGGDIAFEMAHQLRDGGREVALVVMVDNPRPGPADGAPDRGALGRAAERLTDRVRMEWSNLGETDQSQRLRHLARRARTLGERAQVGVEDQLAKTPVPVPPSRAYRAELLARQHEKAYQAYRPRPYGGRVAIIRAARQPAGRASDPTLGWDRYLTGTRDLIEAPGHRIGLLSEPRVGTVSTLLAAAMARALPATAGSAQEILG